MYNTVIDKNILFSRLLDIDRKALENFSPRPCPHCGGVLDLAHYQRKPRGVPPNTPPEFNQRFGLCCRSEGCRKRLTPPSVRFFGRKVWIASVFMIVAILSGSQSPTSCRKFLAKNNISVQQLRRWRQFWAQSYPKSKHWHAQKVFLAGSLTHPPLKLISDYFAYAVTDLCQHLKLLEFLLIKDFDAFSIHAEVET